MGIEPPFIYDKASSYTFAGPTNQSFDPKAATRASWSPPPPKPKRDGPLIDFNKHPDSYLIVPYGNLNVEPMNPKTKSRVKRARKAQLFLRVLSLLGSIGLIFCIIAINKTSTAVGWVIRVGPAVTLCHCVYAVTHLCRDPASRPPASAASYMLFAAMLDTGLIPFYGFSAVMANADYSQNLYGWSTLFNDSDISYKIIFAFFLTCLSEGGLLLISLFLDVYLAVVFRKIAKMPPDMNPLEDNLTARPNGKHKRNKSELHFEKHLSGSTVAGQRLSQITNDSRSNFKRVPFVHTRTDSADSITLYGNEKALNSRVSLRNEINQSNMDPYRVSVASSRDTLCPTRPGSAVIPAANSRAPGAGLDHKPARSSGLVQSEKKKPSSWLSYMDYEGVPSTLSDTAEQQLNDEVRPLSPVSALSERDMIPDRTQIERQNWYQGSPHHAPQRSQAQLPLAHDNVSAESLHDYTNRQTIVVPPPYQSKKRSRDPLGMNPPTPVHNRFHNENSYNAELAPRPLSTPQRPALDDVHVNSSDRPGMGSRPSSFIGSGGKSRYYGKLRDSLGGSPTRESFEPKYNEHIQVDDTSSNYSRTRTMQSEDSGNFKVYDSGDDEDNEYEQEDHQRQLHQNEREYDRLKKLEYAQRIDAITLDAPQQRWDGTRKVSDSTGYDLKTGYAGLGSEFGLGMARRREVSGKVAEEGRTGYGGIGFSEETDGGVITGQGRRGGAAGWAKFHGY